MTTYQIYGLGAVLIDTKAVLAVEFPKHNAMFRKQRFHYTQKYQVHW